MIRVENLNKIYSNGCHALKGVSFKVDPGEFLVVIGLSGSGKSTLLRCLNRLLDITSGEIYFNGRNVSRVVGKTIRYVRSKVGMVFQNFNLISRKTVLVNVLTGSLSRIGIVRSMLEIYPQKEIEKAKRYIEIVGLSGKEHVRADNLSGGQQQRVAIARALMQDPELLLADEPVASLDPATSNSVMKYLKKANEELGLTVICNLHFLSLVRQYATRVIALKDGQLVYEGKPEDIDKQWFKTIYGEDAVEISVN